MVLGYIKFKVRQTWKRLGPGLITGASDDDPSGIATYSQAGAQFGLTTLWTALLTYPLMYVIQEMCARIGLVSGKGLAKIIKTYYPKPILIVIVGTLFAAITFNIGADLAAMGAVMELLIPSIPAALFSSCFAVALVLSLFYLPYQKLAQTLKWLCLSLFLYVIIPFLVHQDWNKVLFFTFIPHFEWSREYAAILVAILGTTISPYLFFWQTSMSVEDKNHKTEKELPLELAEMKSDINVGMLLSNLVMYFIILTTGSVLFPEGLTNIVTVEDAAKALKPLAGEFAHLLFAVGIIGTGILSIPVLAGAVGYACADLFDWKQGMDLKPSQGKQFYATMFATIALGQLLTFFGIDPIQSLIYTAILYGLITPFILAIILHICSNKKIMNGYHNSLIKNVLGITALLLMSGAALAMIWVS